MLQAAEWLKRKVFTLHPLAFEREHMAGLFPGTLSSWSLTCPVRLVWTSSAWGRAGLAEPSGQSQAAPISSGLVIHPSDPASQGQRLSWEWGPSSWLEVCLQLPGGWPQRNWDNSGDFPAGLLWNPLITAWASPGGAEEAPDLRPWGTSSLCSLGSFPISLFQQHRWNVKWQ